jgi:hypothetical protein
MFAFEIQKLKTSGQFQSLGYAFALASTEEIANAMIIGFRHPEDVRYIVRKWQNEELSVDVEKIDNTSNPLWMPDYIEYSTGKHKAYTASDDRVTSRPEARPSWGCTANSSSNILPDIEIPELSWSDTDMPDLGWSDTDMPDLVSTDTDMPDLVSTDTDMPDLGWSDTDMPDLVSTDTDMISTDINLVLIDTDMPDSVSLNISDLADLEKYTHYHDMIDMCDDILWEY